MRRLTFIERFERGALRSRVSGHLRPINRAANPDIYRMSSAIKIASILRAINLTSLR